MASTDTAEPSLHAPIAGPSRLHRLDRVIVFCLIVVTFAVHCPYVLRDTFGEHDAARLANDAIRWRLTGQLAGSSWADYRVRSSPVYVLWLKTLMSSGAVQPQDVPAWMNWLSAVAGAAIAGGLYILARRVLPWEGAGAAVGLTLLAPAVWQGSIYGMPHMPAYAFFVWGLMLFDTALTSKRPFMPLLATWVLFILAGLTKADVLLCSGATIGLVLLNGRRVGRGLAWAVGLVLTAGLVCVFLPQAFLSRGEASATGFVGNWSSHFFIGLDGDAWLYNLRALLIGGGVAAVPAAVVGLVVLLARRRGRLVAFALLWALPLVLFWLVIRANSARHNMAAYFGLFLLVAGAIWQLKIPRATTVARVALVGIVAAVSFFALSFKTYTGTRFPTGRLHAGSVLLKRQWVRLHGMAQSINAHDADKKAYIGKAEGELVLFQVLARAAELETLEPPPELMIANPEGEPAFMYKVIGRGGPSYVMFFRHRPDQEHLVEVGRRLADHGFTIFTIWVEFPAEAGVVWFCLKDRANDAP